MEATLRAGSHERWTLSQQHISLKPQQSVDVQLQLRVLRFAQRRKALTQGQRDVFHISAPYFEQKWHATFFLAASDGGAAAAARPSKSTAAASEGHKAPTGATQQQRRQHALQALVRRKRSSAVGPSPPASHAAQPALQDPNSGVVEAQDDGLPYLEALAAASDISEGTHDWQQPPPVPSQSTSASTGSSRWQTSSQAACNAAFPDKKGSCMAAADQSAGLNSAEADGCCPCRCHGADPGPAGTTLAADHRARDLQLQLDGAAHEVELLQQALSDRDSTIRCSSDEETRIQSHSFRIA